jgi:hypothetical protein
MLGHIFYFIGLIIFLSNLGMLSNFFKINKIKEWSIKFNKVTGRNPIKSDYKEKEFDSFISFGFLMAITFIWMFFGLLTKSWIIFSLLLTFNLLVNLISKSIGLFNSVSNILQFVKLCIVTGIIGILVINHYHLHLDLYKIILQKIV